ncbi:MAG: peptidoglycan bridge formation glycyltransferase FemA/FemB family protein [Chloroflexi bacterium]|nr:peptidoglycan bridge formation glycyltransferase FemA/FemB family protein [Chloroflexota bacterium]
MTVRVRDASAKAPSDWDTLTVEPPGGHVLQGANWADHRAEQGWRPWFLRFSDDRAALVLTVRQPPMPGFLAYAPRGPIAAGDAPAAVAARAVALADWVRARGGTQLVVDPELEAGKGYEPLIRRHGFRPTEEVQASRHRLLLRFAPEVTEEMVLKGVAKQTRQRIRAAEKAGTRVVEDRTGEHFDAFGELLLRTAERKDFYIGSMSATARWWRRAMGAAQARAWVALNDGRLLGGLVVYLHGGHLATAYSADDASLRDALPGTMHLLRWTAIREALAAGAPFIDLGGVDVPGARRLPARGEPLWGLLEHKRSFGAEWVESTAAHQLVIRPWVHRAGRGARAVYRLVRRRGAFPGSGRAGGAAGEDG